MIKTGKSDVKNERNVIPKKEFIEKLENKISEAMETALKYSKKVKDKNDITNILNIEYCLGKYYAYEFLMADLDFKSFIELHSYKRYDDARNECQHTIEKLYH